VTLETQEVPKIDGSGIGVPSGFKQTDGDVIASFENLPYQWCIAPSGGQVAFMDDEIVSIPPQDRLVSEVYTTQIEGYSAFADLFVGTTEAGLVTKLLANPIH
jgi:hypothetical protein